MDLRVIIINFMNEFVQGLTLYKLHMKNSKSCSQA